MKNTLLLSLLLIGGCAAPPRPSPDGPPVPPVPKIKQPALLSPRAASATPAHVFVGAGPAAPPTWVFTRGIDGDYRIDASTNLFDWWPVAAVFSTTNITLISDTINKRPMLFFRVVPKE